MEEITFAGRVHDLGKLFVENRILNKPGTLTEDEFAVVKTHAQIGAQVLRAIPEVERVAQAIEAHHEAFDGSGYPLGLKGENIPLYGRIIAVADAYVNMTSERSFALPKTDEQAITELGKLSGTRFDGMIVRLLARLLKMEKAPVWAATKLFHPPFGENSIEFGASGIFRRNQSSMASGVDRAGHGFQFPGSHRPPAGCRQKWMRW